MQCHNRNVNVNRLNSAEPQITNYVTIHPLYPASNILPNLVQKLSMRLGIITLLLIAIQIAFAQQTRFERSGGTESATYFETIAFYKQLAGNSKMASLKTMGSTDAAYPLHLFMLSKDGTFNPSKWHQQHKVVILINNGIHPGEPDGIDASQLLARDIIAGKYPLPDNVVLAFIPVYNIGGCLNRNSTTRVNQNGPKEYGFRGNSQNLDLNRDFTKCDSKEARSFAQIFHFLDPDILVDNHVSDGADYQHTMTMLGTQADKLGGKLGSWFRNTFEPVLYKQMSSKGWEMIPYMYLDNNNPFSGAQHFYDPPRYSSGYAALFQTIGFVPETHMLKPYKQRVTSTYAFMQTVIEQSTSLAPTLLALRQEAKRNVLKQRQFPLLWVPDTTSFSTFTYKGYKIEHRTSEATGLDKVVFDHNQPFTMQVKLYDSFAAKNMITKPVAYIVPHGWYAVVDLMKLNNVVVKELQHDTTIKVDYYHIDSYKSLPTAWEKHHKNTEVKTSTFTEDHSFLKGDYLIATGQPNVRYIVEMLEPTGDDSFFSWNFFDAILQEKEYFSDYRWEDLAAEVLKNNHVLIQELDAKRNTDTAFAKNSSAQLDYIYRHSKYYEREHLRYPVYRLR
jgi:hypothetical protein